MSEFGPGRHQPLPESAGPENEREAPLAPVPPRADQPGLGRAANPEPNRTVDGPIVNRDFGRVGRKVRQARGEED